MQNAPDSCDVAIVGAGPVGLFAVFECGMLEMGCELFDALPAPGGQCAALYPEKPIYDIPGYPRIDAAELVDRLAEQAAPFDPKFHLGHAVTRLVETADGFIVETLAGTRVAARAVVIAAGAGAFGPNRPPRLAADCLLPVFGLATDLGPLAGWGLDLDHNHISVDPASCAASRPGIFAIGDIATYPGKLKLILSGFAEAALAAHAIHPLVHPGEALHFEYSTTQGVPAL